MPTIFNKTVPANVIPQFVKDLRLALLHCQVELVVIGIDAMVSFRPLEDLDRLIVYKNGFTVFKN